MIILVFDFPVAEAALFVLDCFVFFLPMGIDLLMSADFIVHPIISEHILTTVESVSTF